MKNEIVCKMIAEFNEKECLFLMDFIGRYQKAIKDGISKMKSEQVIIKMPVEIMTEEYARKLYRLTQPLFITFFKGARGY